MPEQQLILKQVNDGRWPGDDGVALAGRHAAVQPQVRDGGQFGFQQVVLHDVQHALELTEDKHSMLGHHRLSAPLRSSTPSEATVQQQLENTKHPPY